MSRSDKPSRIETQLLAVLQGAAQVLARGRTLVFPGKTHDLASLLALVGGLLAPYERVHELRTLLQKALGDRRWSAAEAARVLRQVRNAAAAAFGEQSLEFALLGFKPKKTPAELTPEQKQQKVERLRATRAARHTMGKRQRQAVKGEVPPPAGEPGARDATIPG